MIVRFRGGQERMMTWVVVTVSTWRCVITVVATSSWELPMVTLMVMVTAYTAETSRGNLAEVVAPDTSTAYLTEN